MNSHDIRGRGRIAHELGVSERTVSRLVAAGKLKAFREGPYCNSVLVARADDGAGVGGPGADGDWNFWSGDQRQLQWLSRRDGRPYDQQRRGAIQLCLERWRHNQRSQ